MPAESAHGERLGVAIRQDEAAAPTIGESRLVPALALLAFIVLNVSVRLWLPQATEIHLGWLVPAVEVALLLVLLASDPTRLRHRLGWLHRTALALVLLLVGGALASTALLVRDLIEGHGVANDAGDLLAAGAVVWLGNNLAFGLLYWLLDGGGPVERARDPSAHDFAFTQQLNPEVAPPGWRPLFLDYLHLGFTNATAFSPTDVMPLTHRAKTAMLVQATVALLLVGLIVARAVNAFR
jgi:uncharacterized membrane protein